MLTRIQRIIKISFASFFRNGWLSLTATLITTLALLSIGIFLIVSLSANKVVQELKGKIDIVVNFKDEASEASIQEIRSELLARPNIQTVRYISKADALNEFKSRSTVKKEVRELVTAEDNPLPRGLQIQSVDFSEYEYVASLIKRPESAPLIDSSSYEDNKVLIDNINNATKFIERFGLILSLIFIIVAILVVFNTVRLAVSFKSKEIEVMRLVGASESFVRVPFLIEGFLHGFFATIVSVVLIFAAMALAGYLSQATIFARFINRLTPVYFEKFWLITLLQFAVGAVIGVGASWLSIRKNVKL